MKNNENYILQEEDYQFLYELIKRNVKRYYKDNEMYYASYLFDRIITTYHCYPDESSNSYKFLKNHSKIPDRKKSAQIFKRHVDSGFKNMPKIDLFKNLESAWPQDFSYQQTLEFYEYLKSKKINLFHEIIENGGIKNAHSSLCKHCISLLEKGKHVPNTFMEKDYLVFFTENLASVINTTSQKYCLRMLHYLTSHKEAYGEELIKDLIGKFSTYHKTISNENIKLYQSLQELYKDIDFSEQEKEYPYIKKFTRKDITNGFSKNEKNDIGGQKIEYIVDMNDVARYYNYYVKYVKDNMNYALDVIEKSVNLEYKNVARAKKSYKRSIAILQVDTQDKKIINLIDTMLDLMQSKCASKTNCSYEEVKDFWNKQTMMIYLSESLNNKENKSRNKI